MLCPPGTEHREIYNFGKVHSLRDYVSRDGGDTFDRRFVYPKSMDSSRPQICYAEDVRPKDITTTGFITFKSDADPAEDSMTFFRKALSKMNPKIVWDKEGHRGHKGKTAHF